MNCFLLIVLSVTVTQITGHLNFGVIWDICENTSGTLAILLKEERWEPELVAEIIETSFCALHIEQSKLNFHLVEFLANRFSASFCILNTITFYKCKIYSDFLLPLNLSHLGSLRVLKINFCKMVNVPEFSRFLMSDKYSFQSLNLDNNGWIIELIRCHFLHPIGVPQLKELSLKDCNLVDDNFVELVQFLLLFEGLETVDLRNNPLVQNGPLLKRKFVQRGGNKDVQFKFKTEWSKFREKNEILEEPTKLQQPIPDESIEWFSAEIYELPEEMTEEGCNTF